MCGRFSNIIEKRDLSKIHVDVPVDFGNDINISPTDEVWAFGSSMKLGKIRWGMDGTQALVINARSESIMDKTMFRDDFSKGYRCLVPCDSFYEFPVIDERKACIRFHPNDQSLWLMAGVFTKKFRSETEFCWQMAILTTSANSVISPFHDRMPVFVDPSDLDTWFHGSWDGAQRLCHPLDAQAMSVIEVNPKLRSNSFKEMSAHEPYDPPESFKWL
jgi:putative SOS response-associated peptidase YedK